MAASRAKSFCRDTWNCCAIRRRSWPSGKRLAKNGRAAWSSKGSACKGNELLTDEGCATNGFDNFEKIWFWRTPTGKCETEGKCVPYSQWAKDYIAILGQ